MSLFSSISNAAASIGHFVSTEWAKITGEVPVIEAALENAATVANNLVNGLKNWIASPAGKTIEAIIAEIPGISPYLTDLLNFLPTLVVDLGWAKNEFTKSPADVLADGIDTAVNNANSDVKATNLITLQAHINKFVSGLSQAPQSIQTAISIAPTVYSGVTAPALAA